MNKKTVHIFCRQLIVEYFLLVQVEKMKKADCKDVISQTLKLVSRISTPSHSLLPSFHSPAFENFFSFLFYFRRLVGFYKVFYFLTVFIILSGHHKVHVR